MKSVHIVNLILVVLILILKKAESEVCRYDEGKSEVTSPNYPDAYPNSYKCTFSFKNTPGCKLKIEFYGLEMEVCENCGCDYIAFFEGSSENHPLLKQFCTLQQSSPIISTSDRVFMVFRTDGGVVRNGFKFFYSIVCPHFLPTNTSVQNLTVGGNSAVNQMNKSNSEWIFRTDTDYAIKLKLNSFHLPEFYDCNSNYVAFYDGPTSEDPLLGRFCSSIPPTISSTKHQMLMVVKFGRILPKAIFRAEYWADFNIKSISDERKRSSIEYFLNIRHKVLSINKWGSEIARTAVALLLYDPQFFAPGNETGEEIAYELTLQLQSKLVLRKQISTADLALYVNALTAACIDPTNFFGVNIVAELRKRVDNSNYTNPFFILTLCNAGEKMEMEDVLILKQLFGEYLRPTWTDIQAMIVMALKCISKQSNMDLDITLNEMVSQLKSRQKTNGMIDNMKNTALVTQAIIATEISITGFNMSNAINSMLNYAKHSDVTIEEMYYLLPILKWRTLMNISSDHCSGMIETDLGDHRIHEADERIMVEFSIVIGDAMDFLQTWRVRVPSNYTFYQVLENITTSELNYKVRYVFLDGKPYVAGLANFNDNTDTGKFWFIYARSAPSGENVTLLKMSPVDIQVNVTNNLLLWYKSLSWSSTQELPNDVSHSQTQTFTTTEANL